MLALAAPSVQASTIRTADILAIEPTASQGTYDAVREFETRIASGQTAECRDTADSARQYLAFARRSSEWFDRGPAPINSAMSTAMRAHAEEVRSQLNALQEECPELASIEGGRPSRSTDTPVSRGLWDGWIDVAIGDVPDARRATITIDPDPFGRTDRSMTTETTVGVRDGRVRARVAKPSAGIHSISIKVDVEEKPRPILGVLTLPDSAFVPPAKEYREAVQLQQRLQALVDRTTGTGAAYVLDVETGAEACANSRVVFPAASLAKLPIMYAGVRATDGRLASYWHDISTIGGWSSNVAAGRFVALAGEQAVAAQLVDMGATNSGFGGSYMIGTSYSPDASPCSGASTRVGSTTTEKTTTSRDVGQMLAYVLRRALQGGSKVDQRILTSLVASERAGDNRGIGLDELDGTTLAAVKNGWYTTDLFHTASILFESSGPRIVVTMTSGMDRSTAETFAREAMRIARATTGDLPVEGAES